MSINLEKKNKEEQAQKVHNLLLRICEEKTLIMRKELLNDRDRKRKNSKPLISVKATQK